MRVRHLLLALCLAVFAPILSAQNFTTITGAFVQDASGIKLAAGTICFQPTDANSLPLNFQAGGGGQSSLRPVCATVTNGVIGNIVGTSTAFQVATPASTTPTGIAYTVQVKDSAGKVVITYYKVQPTGASWSFDAYAPSAVTLPTPTPASITGNFTVNGNLSVTGSSILGTITFTTLNAGTINASVAVNTAALNATGASALATLSTTGNSNLATSSGSVGVGTASPISKLANTTTTSADSGAVGGIATSLNWAISAAGYGAVLANSSTAANANGLLVAVANLPAAASQRVFTAQGGGADVFYITNRGIGSNTAGHKDVRTGIPGSVAAASNLSVSVPFVTAFPDTNYTATCSVSDSTGNLAVWSIVPVAGSITAVIHNNDGSVAHSGTVHCKADHDPT
jgi:hypothetical protein